MNEQSKAIESIIKMAITGEEESHALYTKAARLVKGAQSRAMLEELATDELGHKAKLEGLLRQGISWTIAEGAFKRVADLKVGDHLEARPLAEGADLQDALIVAIQREKESHDLYASLAGISGEEIVRNLFDFLANEELTHKRKVEALYEEIMYQHF